MYSESISTQKLRVLVKRFEFSTGWWLADHTEVVR
jgi:hypothetical protein